MWPDRARPGLCFEGGFKKIRELASSRGSRIAAAGFAIACCLAALTVLADDSLPAGVVYASNTDPVRITSITYSPAEIKRGGTVVAQVVCTSNAAAVTAKVGTIVMNLSKRAPGIFRATLQLPWLPVYDSHETVTITAIRTDGASATRTFMVEIH